MKKSCLLIALLAVLLVLPAVSFGGVKLKIAEDTEIDLGFRVQTHFLSTEDFDGDTRQDFNLRRARLRLGGKVTKWVGFFLQTDAVGENGTGRDMRLIDGFVTLNLNDLANIYMGEHMAPAGRQITTSSGGLMAIDRPNITNYNLTWGLNGRVRFNSDNFPDGNLGLSGDVNVRDLGATLFGKYSFTDYAHVKYYAGVYNGIQENANDEDNERYTARIQFNFLDAEPGYYNLSTYLGKKKTVGIGFSYDAQDAIATDAFMGNVDYSWWEADAFLELPVGPGDVTLEGAFMTLDLDGATSLNDGSGTPRDTRRTEGDGWYVQAGYFLKDYNLQPWVEYETWDSEASDGQGGFDSFRVGLSYFIKGHNANVKIGYENFQAEKNFPGTSEDTIDTFLIGFYVTY